MAKRRPTLGSYLRAHRRERGLTLQAVADQVGVAKSVVFNWEADRMAPKPPKLERLAATLALDLAHLYALAGYPMVNELPELEDYLARRYPQLRRDEVTQIAHTVVTAVEQLEKERDDATVG